MSKPILECLMDAIVRRVGAVFSNMLLRRLTTTATVSEAAETAALEQQAAQLHRDGQPLAAKRIERHLAALNGDDPCFEIATSFARQLMADDFDVDTPELRGDVVAPTARPHARTSRFNGKPAKKSRK